MTQHDISSFRKDLRRLERELFLVLSDETACCQVTVAQCHLLLEVEQRTGANLQELADALSLDKSTLSRTVDSCVQAGLLTRINAPDDRRKVAISLSPEGKQKCEYINTLCNAQFSSIFSRIPSAKQVQVLEAVALFAEAIDCERREGIQSCCGGKAPCA